MSAPMVFKAFYWVWIGSEILLQIVTRTSRSSGQVKDRGSLILLLTAIGMSVWAAIWYGETHPHTMPGGADNLRLAALILLIAGLALRWTAVLSLGASFSTNVAIHATQTVKTNGLYRWMRHPSYTGMLMIFWAIGIAERNWLSVAIMLIFPTAALLYRIHVEEIALNEAFGEGYSEYSRVTRRLIPGVY